ncbi:MAG: TonB-dependent receptor [Saprospiraceae bacterium]|nr:TonB-dependent receptor [Saprospiraceae bacterium]
MPFHRILFTGTFLIFWVQLLSQSIRGTVADQFTHSPIAFANIVVLGSDPMLGAVSDETGHFVLEHLRPGRYDVEVSFLGYETLIYREVLVSEVKDVELTIFLRETSVTLSEVVVKPKVQKERPLNPSAAVSARMLSVEEASRYAGGFDDPARLASAFAGVAGNVGSNGIVVRGNAPKSLQWKLEGVEIPNPNHFADLSSFGGGGLTALSSKLLANSDFLTSAFPAEYQNALSGVFDIFMRSGNNTKAEHTVELGIIGLDVASEGPFKKNSRASYLFNYRYSTLALLEPLLPENGGGVRYQDFSFKINLPTKKSGVFSLWGLGLKDFSGQNPVSDSTRWQYEGDRERQAANQGMAAGGLSHKWASGKSLIIRSIAAWTSNGLDLVTQNLNPDGALFPKNIIQSKLSTLVLKSSLSAKINNHWSWQSGFTLTGLIYDLSIRQAPFLKADLQTITAENGSSSQLAAYVSGSYRSAEKIEISGGLAYQRFMLNGRQLLEPRLGLRWMVSENNTFSLGYGKHSRLEKLNFYFAQNLAGEQINRNLDFSKSHHLVLGYDRKLGNNTRLKAEIYGQYLFNLPVIRDSSFSLVNLQSDFFFDDKLVNEGYGKNYGLDLTVEQYMTRGFYFMTTLSLYRSLYQGGDRIWRPTRFDKKLLANVLLGKEWMVGHGRQNILGINLRWNLQGGERYSPVDEQASLLARDVIFMETAAFSKSLSPSHVFHFTLKYKKNRKKISQEFALKVINVTNQTDFLGFRYNQLTRQVDENREAILIPNLSYRIDF